MFTTNVYNEVQDLRIVAPSIQASGINFDPETGLLTFTRGNGLKVIVLISNKPIVKHPFNQHTYDQYDLIGCSIVAYKGTDDEVDLTELLSAGHWYVRVYEFNGSASVERYNINVGVDNPIDFILGGDEGVFDETFDDTFE